MKAFKLFMAAAIVLSALSSCQKDQVIVYDDPTVINSVLITIDRDDWRYSDIGPEGNYNNYFYATVDMPEITQSAFKTGIVKMYRVWDYGTQYAEQKEMPCSLQIERCIDTGNDTWEFYTESIDYSFGVGYMTIYYSLSNFDYEIDESIWPDTMQFRCVVME